MHSHTSIGPESTISSPIRYAFTVLFLVGSVVLWACATPQRSQFYRPYAGKGNQEYKAIGLASWYGQPFHGRRTASGERYDMNEMTCAHKSLPFGAMLKVTNLRNNKSVIVKVNDRGPFVRDRLIDLSRAAANQLAFVRAGTAKVCIEWINDPPNQPNLSSAREDHLANKTAKDRSIVAQNEPTTEKSPDVIGDLINGKKLK